MSALDDWNIDDHFKPASEVDWILIGYGGGSGLADDLISSIALERYGLNSVCWVHLNAEFNPGQIINGTDLFNFTESLNTKFNALHKIIINKNNLVNPANPNSIDYAESGLLYIFKYLNQFKSVDINRLSMYTGRSRRNNSYIELELKAAEDPAYAGDMQRYLEDHPELDAAQLIADGIMRREEFDPIPNSRKGFLTHHPTFYQFNEENNKLFNFNNKISRPFKTLLYEDMAQLAINLNKEDVLINSWNCYRSMIGVQPRCGVCDGCRQFKSALSAVGKLKDVEFAE